MGPTRVLRCPCDPRCVRNTGQNTTMTGERTSLLPRSSRPEVRHSTAWPPMGIPFSLPGKLLEPCVPIASRTCMCSGPLDPEQPADFPDCRREMELPPF